MAVVGVFIDYIPIKYVANLIFKCAANFPA